MQRLKILSIVMSIFIIGCASNLPMTSSLNDFVTMSTKTNSTEKVQLQFDSNIVDGMIKPFEKDKVKEVSGHPGFNHTESATLGRMIKEYMGNKFVNYGDSGDTKISATLTDFWIEQYSTDSTGKQVLAVLGGGEINMLCVAKVKLLLKVNRHGEELTKIISASSDDTYVVGVGTGTETSYLYKGKNSIEHTHANNINKVNNKVIMLMNSYLGEIGL
jgi:hypothetical protein